MLYIMPRIKRAEASNEDVTHHFFSVYVYFSFKTSKIFEMAYDTNRDDANRLEI